MTGWEVHDVICLLPLEAFLPGFGTWGDVEARRSPRQNMKEVIKELHPQHRQVFRFRHLTTVRRAIGPSGSDPANFR